MSRSKSALKFVLSSTMIQIVIVISGLILPPLMISEYGSEINGIVGTIKQLITYFSIVSLGLGITSQVALYKPLDEGNWPKINGILSATHYFFNRTGIVFLILILITSFVFPYYSNATAEKTTIFLIIIIYGIGAISEYIFISKYRVLLAADQKQNVISNIQSQGIIITTVFSVILILLHKSIIFVLVVSTISYLIRLLMTINYVKKRYPKLDFNVKPNYKALEGKWQAFSYQIANMITNYTPIIIIAIFCGFIEASVFSIYNMIFFSLTMITAIFSAGFSAPFGNLIVKNEIKLLQSAFKSYEFIYRNIMFIVYTIAFIVTIPFVSVYIKNNDGVNYIVPMAVVAFVIQGLFKSFRIPFVTLVEAAGLFEENKKLNIIEAIINVLLSLIFVKFYGFVGVLLGGIVSAFFRSILYVVFSQKEILKKVDYVYFFKLLLNLILSLALYQFFEGSQIGSLLEFPVLLVKIIFPVLFSFIILNTILDFKASEDSFYRLKKMFFK